MIFVLEIKGTAVLAFDADNMDDARAYAANAGEREDLTELRSNGAPLWNGKDDISARAATDAEADLFEERRKFGDSSNDPSSLPSGLY
jgi:hypothetical protein